MTLQDLIDFLRDASAEQTLTALAIARTILLAYEMGLEAGKAERSSPDSIAAQINLREAESLAALRRSVDG